MSLHTLPSPGAWCCVATISQAVLTLVGGAKAPLKLVFMNIAWHSGPNLLGWGSLRPPKSPGPSSAPRSSARGGPGAHSPPRWPPGTHLAELGQLLHAHRLHLYLEVFESRCLGQLAASFARKTLLFLCQRQLGKHFLQPGARFFRNTVPGDPPQQGWSGRRGPQLSFGASLGPCRLSSCAFSLRSRGSCASRALGWTFGQRVALPGCLQEQLAQLALSRARLGAVEGHFPTTAYARSWGLGGGLRALQGIKVFLLFYCNLFGFFNCGRTRTQPALRHFPLVILLPVS